MRGEAVASHRKVERKGKIMDKKDLAAQLSKNIDITKSLSTVVVDELFNIMIGTLAREEDVRITGFGTFKISPVKPRTMLSALTNEVIKIEPHNRVSFKASPCLKEAVR